MAQMQTGVPRYIPSLPPRKWGESEVAYRQRVMDFQAPMQRTEGGVRQLVDETTNLDAATLEKQKGIQSQRLQELSSFLAAEEGRKFNQSIPEMAETAQGQGFLNTSGFGNALARERVKLAGDTSARLTEQGLSDRDFEVNALGGTNTNTKELLTGGLERKFSLEDLDRSEALSRELARLGIVNPKGESNTDKNFRRAESAVGIGAGLAQIGAGK